MLTEYNLAQTIDLNWRIRRIIREERDELNARWVINGKVANRRTWPRNTMLLRALSRESNAIRLVEFDYRIERIYVFIVLLSFTISWNVISMRHSINIPALALAVGESNVTWRRGRFGGDDTRRTAACRAGGTGESFGRPPPPVDSEDTNMPRSADSADSGMFRGGGGRCSSLVE